MEVMNAMIPTYTYSSKVDKMLFKYWQNINSIGTVKPGGTG